MPHLLTNRELSSFSGQLAMILHSGISSLEGISILCEDASDAEEKQLLETITQSLEETGEFAEALRASGAFPEYYLKMAEIGERSGTLDELMESLADYYGRQDSMMRSIRESLTYPLILLGMLSAVLIVLMTQVMPVFREVFEQLGIEMTGVTSTVFRVGDVLQSSSAVFLVLIIGLAAGCMVGLRTDKGRSAILSAASHLPSARAVNRLLACSRFSDALSLSLHSGLDIGESFTLAVSLANDPLLEDQFKKAEEALDQGMDLSEALKDARIFTGLNARLVSIGCRTGSAEDALRKVAVDCQSQADARIQNIIGALEPTLTAVLSILTGLILISVMLPLLGVMTNIG